MAVLNAGQVLKKGHEYRRININEYKKFNYGKLLQIDHSDPIMLLYFFV